MEEKKCKYCAMMIPKEAKICPHCRKKQGTSLAVGCLTVFLILIAIGMAVSAFKEQSAPIKQLETAKSPTPNGTSKTSDATQPRQASHVATNWMYGESKDEMSGKVTKHAITSSLNTVNFDFPYQGAQHGTIMVYNNVVLFYVERGQVICHGGSEYGSCVVKVKFDGAKEKWVGARTSGDDSTTIRFTEPGFLRELRKSKKLMVQVEVFHNGYPVFTFDVAGLSKKY